MQSKPEVAAPHKKITLIAAVEPATNGTQNTFTSWYVLRATTRLRPSPRLHPVLNRTAPPAYPINFPPPPQRLCRASKLQR